MSFQKGSIKSILVAPTLVAAAYASGDVLGTAIIDVPNFSLDSTGVGVLESLSLLDRSATGAAIDVNFFGDTVSPGADNAPFTLSSADALKWLGCISLVAGDYAAAAGAKLATKIPLGLILKSTVVPPNNVSVKNIKVVLVARAAITIAAATDLQLRLGVVQA